VIVLTAVLSLFAAFAATVREPIVQEPDVAPPRPTARQLEELESAYQTLHGEYERAYKSWADGYMAARKTGKDPYADDPTRIFLPRFRELLAKGLDHAAVSVLAGDADISWQENLALFERLATEHARESWASEIVDVLPAVFLTTDWERVSRACDAFVEQRQGDALAARLVFEVASNLKDVVVVEGPETVYEHALVYYHRYLERWPDGAQAELARQGIFALEHLRVGKPAPELVGKDVDGNELRLSSLRGKVVVIDFWATWCAPCRRELPHLKDLLALHPRGFAVLGVANDDDPEEFRPLLRTLEVTWPNVFEGATSGPISQSWSVSGLPTVFVLDAEGVIRAKQPQDLDALVEKLMHERGAPVPTPPR